jgi:hypothetical protein
MKYQHHMHTSVHLLETQFYHLRLAGGSLASYGYTSYAYT